MKNILIIHLILLSIIVNGQTTKNRVSQLKTTLTIEDTIKLEAETWFKNVYVEALFKDPYSYKHLKTIVSPKNWREALIDSIARISSVIETINLTSEEKLPETRTEYQIKYEKSLAEIDEINKLSKEEKEFAKEDFAKMVIYSQEIANILKELMLKIDLYNLNIKIKALLEIKLDNLTPEQSKQLVYYEIKIDCYSNNSIGNQILGRFCFPFTKNGAIGSNNGLNSVIHLNKE
jgi:hypothetical protein